MLKHWYDMWDERLDKILIKLATKKGLKDDWEDLKQDIILFMLERSKEPRNYDELKFVVVSIAKYKLSKKDSFRKHERNLFFTEQEMELILPAEEEDSTYVKIVEYFIFKGLSIEEAEDKINLLLGYDVGGGTSFSRKKERDKLIRELKKVI